MEDALRRDLTINALFYNINTGMVEDFTKQGRSILSRNTVSLPGVGHSGQSVLVLNFNSLHEMLTFAQV